MIKNLILERKHILLYRFQELSDDCICGGAKKYAGRRGINDSSVNYVRVIIILLVVM